MASVPASGATPSPPPAPAAAAAAAPVPTSSKKAWKNIAAGAAAGAIEATVMFPTEYVKTQMQLLETSGRASSIFGVARHTFATHGVLGFYRGLSSLVVGGFFKAGIRFGTFNEVKQLLSDERTGQLTPLRSMLAGMITGAAEATFAVTPSETVKTKLIHDQNSAKPKYRGFAHGIRTMIAEDGVAGIYKGLAPTILRQAANSATRFTVYDTVKAFILKRKAPAADGKPHKDLNGLESMFAGTCAGTINVYVTMPLDVMKTRLQGLQSAKYTGVWDCGRKIVQTEGVLQLWKGTLPRLSRVGVAGGITFTSMEQTMKLLNTISPDAPQSKTTQK